ncbi:MAG TPA: TcpE family conjugal transfer membrane protein [Acidimicrobiales bacterium]|nr:TcpE family conjugal transfer membrane protein [Acidimicrobiales bacterium]
MADDAEHIACRSYTHARRHPNVIGVIGGWVLPWPITPTQLGVLLGSAMVLLATRSAWAVLPGGLGLFVMAGGPLGLAWAVRHLRIEGRSPMRMANGALSYLARPRRGTLRGRPYRPPGPSRQRARFFVVGGGR